VVNVAAAPPVLTEDRSDLEALYPKNRVMLRTGDTLDIACQDAIKKAAQFRFSSGGEFIPMEESTRTPGIYRGAYTFKPNDEFDESDVIFSLKRKDGKKITGTQIERNKKNIKFKDNSGKIKTIPIENVKSVTLDKKNEDTPIKVIVEPINQESKQNFNALVEKVQELYKKIETLTEKNKEQDDQIDKKNALRS
jgi:hypothetical protein